MVRVKGCASKHGGLPVVVAVSDVRVVLVEFAQDVLTFRDTRLAPGPRDGHGVVGFYHLVVDNAHTGSNISCCMAVKDIPIFVLEVLCCNIFTSFGQLSTTALSFYSCCEWI